MDKAIHYSEEHFFGEIVHSNTANGYSSYFCLSCNEEVIFVRESNRAVAHFSHRKKGLKDCDLRVFSFGNNHSLVKTIQKWFFNNTLEDVEYLPSVPSFILEDENTWKPIAYLVAAARLSKQKYDFITFRKDLSEKMRHRGYSNISRILKINHEIPDLNIFILFWESFLRFRMLYRIYKKNQKSISEEYSYVMKYISLYDKRTVKNKEIFFIYNSSKKTIKTYIQIEDKREEIDTNCYLKEAFLNLKKSFSYIVAKYDDWDSKYVLKNGQVSIGTKVILIGKITEFQKYLHIFQEFSETEISVVTDLDGVDDYLGLIMLNLQMPKTFSLLKCPHWIAWSYVYLSGGLKLKNENVSNSYFRDCPPKIIIDESIKRNMLTIKNNDNESVNLEIVDGVLKIPTCYEGLLNIRVKGLYSICLNLKSPDAYNIKHSFYSYWRFSEKWPEIVKDQLLTDSLLSGCALIGDWKIESTKSFSKEKEWMYIHSNRTSECNYLINKIISNRR